MNRNTDNNEMIIAGRIRERCKMGIILLSLVLVVLIPFFALTFTINPVAVIVTGTLLTVVLFFLVLFIRIRKDPLRYRKYFFNLERDKAGNMADSWIDRTEWHLEKAEERFRKDTGITGEMNEEQKHQVALMAANHIGLFMRWIIEHGYEGKYFDKEDVEKVRNGQMSGPEFFIKNCRNRLGDTDFRYDIVSFVKRYYERDYLNDYRECCLDGADEMDYVITNEEQYARLSERLDEAYKKNIRYMTAG